MSAFLQLERDVDDYLEHEATIDPSDPAVQQLKERLLQYVSTSGDDKDVSLFGDEAMGTVDSEIGAKRKLCVQLTFLLCVPSDAANQERVF